MGVGCWGYLRSKLRPEDGEGLGALGTDGGS